jgi:hypothetical protein
MKLYCENQRFKLGKYCIIILSSQLRLGIQSEVF